MESPEEFVNRDDVRRDLDGENQRLVDVETIRARDNAVRLALLSELEARAVGMIPYPLREQVAALRLKYSPPRGRFCGKCGAEQEERVLVGSGRYRTVG